MTRWKLVIEYDGGGFCGWQRQREGVSAQGVIEAAIRAFSGEDAVLHVAGRTDAGVHAQGQVAHFDLEKEVAAERVRDALNFHVRPHPLAILSAEEAAADFHARFDATSRIYRYTIVNRRPPLALSAGRAWHVRESLDETAMREAARILLGKHDFSTFRASGCQSSSPIKTLDRLDIERCGETIFLETSARSFLYHQVRNMVGTLALVGSGRWSVEDFARAFAAASRGSGGPTAPPEGLCLMKVEYP